MTNINLTAPLIDRDLTAPDRINTHATPTILINADDTRIARNGDIRIARNGDIRVAHNTSLVYPLLLTAVIADRDLTAPERM
jgi:hypothetical protein